MSHFDLRSLSPVKSLVSGTDYSESIHTTYDDDFVLCFIQCCTDGYYVTWFVNKGYSTGYDVRGKLSLGFVLCNPDEKLLKRCLRCPMIVRPYWISVDSMTQHKKQEKTRISEVTNLQRLTFNASATQHLTQQPEETDEVTNLHQIVTSRTALTLESSRANIKTLENDRESCLKYRNGSCDVKAVHHQRQSWPNYRRLPFTQRVTKRPSISFSMLWNWVVLLLPLLLMQSTAEAKFVEGYLRTAEKWAFLTRFCFLSNDGTFSFDVEYDMEYATEKLLLYYDSPHQWPAVYKSDKTCGEKEGVMKRENNQFINLTLFSISSECEVIRAAGDKATYHCKGSRSFKSVRERWWFIAVSNCESTKGLQLKYKISMTNGFNYWTKHFSADEFYILRTDIIAMLLQLGILFLSLLATAELKSRQLFHTTYRLYLTGVVFQVLGLIFLNLHYTKYGYNGIGLPKSKLIGQLFLAVANIMMVLMLLLMAKGFNITRGRLRQASAVRLTTFICLFCICYATLFIYEQKVFDPGEVLYVYESPAGYGLVVLRCIAWLMFVYACFFTVKHYPEKYKFYFPFFVFYTFWFLSGPVVILVANHVIDKWVREKVVNGVELSISLLGQLFFLFLTRPSAANKNFPYHVRTTQIMALESSSSGVVGNNTLDAFSAHPYAPDLSVEPKNRTTSDLFLVSGAVEMEQDRSLTRPIQGSRSIVKEDKSFPHYEPSAPPPVFPPETLQT